ncbi:MAG: aminodeoxychorismate/anthranilate synthase component II [Armatimonadetes bacterium]|nr:aminodeoxychorismate/anthranilate synthase component II [Armatimonadota bacterium]
MILVIDNYDSFTYNLVQYLGQCGAEVVVKRNDEIDLDGIATLKPDGIMLSPGPCTPKESGVCLTILSAALAQRPGFDVPLFGVCLGHQAIGEVTGSQVVVANKIMHGKASLVEHDGKGVFANMPNPFSAIRYHSLVIAKKQPPAGFIVTARSLDDDEIMGVRHETLPIEGVQFHPESVLTEQGFTIVENFYKMTKASATAGVS